MQVKSCTFFLLLQEFFEKYTEKGYLVCELKSAYLY